ncbi:GumC family protein, partial [Flavobacterium croceum]|uniref:GumC family protein n=1 Tax=Flavobacterium croceum TaxID=370975 RepID=UPI0024A97C13
MNNAFPPLDKSNKTTSYSEFNVKDVILEYLEYWKWFVLSVIVAFVAVMVYLRYYVPRYGVATTILIKDDKKGGQSELSAFSDLNLFSTKSSVENEIAILKSRELSQRVVSSMDLDISYFSEGRVVTRELYNGSPIKVQFITKSEKYSIKDTSLVVKKVSEKAFVLSDFSKKKETKYLFGQPINTSLGKLVVLQQAASSPVGTETFVVKSKLEPKALSFAGNLGIQNQEKTNVITLTINDILEQRAKDYLNSLVQQYNIDAINDRNEVANNTQKFIDERLVIINKELGEVETDAEVYKKQNRLTNLEADAQINLTKAEDYEKALIELETQIKVGQLMLSEVKKLKPEETIPSNIINGNETAAGYIQQYNQLVLERKKIAVSATDSNPKIKTIDAQLQSIKSNIVESIKSKESDLKINQSDIAQQKNIFQGKVGQVPTHEKIYTSI